MNQFDYMVLNAALAKGLGSDLARLITAQARLESGDYSSNVFNRDNNLFGYKYVGQSGATQGTAAPASEGGYYAHYATIADSVNELVGWLIRRQNQGLFDISNLTTPEAYASALKSGGYFGISAAEYAAGLKSKLQKIEGSNSAMDGTVYAVAIGAAFALLYYLKKRK